MPGDTLKVALIGGTMFLKTFKPLVVTYYSDLIRDCGVNHLVTLPDGGRMAFAKGYPQVEAEIESSLGDGPLVLIAHSQGAYYAVHYAATHTNVCEIILMAGPMQGTLLAWPAKLVPAVASWLFPAALDMCPGSDTVKMLNQELAELADRITVIRCGRIDWLVWPITSSHVDGARHHFLPGHHHVNMVRAEMTVEVIGKIIADASANALRVIHPHTAA